ncbi:MAG: hypothetical protein JSR47_14880 [Proteobacteria bacterium]|nr:hypothetical protein [Pseudomonadota bacterium]MBS0550006.1 hypothetical protein [Pseudomonadota bacterium]
MTDNVSSAPMGAMPMEGLPPSIRLFERLQVSALVVGWANASLTYRDVLHDRVNPFLFAAALSALSALVFVLVAGISRRRSTTCKWILIVLSAAGIAPWFTPLRHDGAFGLHSALSLVQGTLQFGSCALLIAGDSRAWFASRED